MHECPHCKQESISTLQKLFAISPFQVNCASCNQYSHILGIYAFIALTAWIIMTWMLIGLAYMFQMSFLVLGTVPAMVIAVDRFLVNAPLYKVQN